MLAADEKRLRWLGMDMRARAGGGARLAVVLTYLGYVIEILHCADLPAGGLLTPTAGSFVFFRRRWCFWVYFGRAVWLSRCTAGRSLRCGLKNLGDG